MDKKDYSVQYKIYYINSIVHFLTKYPDMEFRIQARFLLLVVVSLLLAVPSFAQRKKKKQEATEETKKEKHPLEEVSVSGLKFRNIGPALTSGRISDFAVNPANHNEYYVATSSGGVWKTVNAGTTYKPIFDSQGSYSIGCVTIDPNNHNVVWVGSGENNNQRSVAYGDGIYKSTDGGSSWKNMGLKMSEHIGNIIVDPRNSDVVYVAAIGPVWSAGGDRGVYKTTDGGENWEKVLEIDEHTGVNDIIMDPRNPDVLYAAAYQRRRHVFTYIGGGPGSGMHKTTDGGKTWTKINKGLPSVDIGRIGLTFSPADPEIIYAIVEAAQGKGGFYRSTNRGASWEKRSSHVTSGNYYQEIIADPKDPDLVYSMDTWFHVSDDGGKSFRVVGEDTKHVDNHCMWIDPNNTEHWLIGCDGGIYETWDAAKTWDFKANLPVTQFYKVAVDNSEPFYFVYGGTQDNFSLGGPSRVTTDHGILNSDWFITHGGDGFESQIDPKNPDIVYTQSQYGVLARYDRKNGEEVGIQPQPRKGENAYRWNWDAPLAVSHHRDGRLYFAANKLFRSDDRGNSWDVLGDDLTRQVNRNELKVMGRVWGIDALAKNGSTSPYGTIVAFSESPMNEDLLYVGTDDGFIQVTEDGGKSWTTIDVNNIAGAPERTYVNSVYASQHNENVVYAAFNHHKYGDFKPYIFKSADKGKTWTAISNNLPERGSVYSIEEDHVDPNLIFVGTEFSVFFSNDGGKFWKKLSAGLPTIAVRDIAIQRRENDLVLGTFGRGFFVLDDYTPLRSLGKETLDKEAELFAVRPGLQFEKSLPLGLPGKAFQGDSYYSAENLGPVAMFTYYLKEGMKTKEEARREKEKEAKKEGKDNSYPSYDALKAEGEDEKAQLVFTIQDASGQVIRKLLKSPSKGVNRFHWDMRYAPKDAISFYTPSFYNAFADTEKGPWVQPGTYSLTMSKLVNGEMTKLAGPLSFEVKRMGNATLPTKDVVAKTTFQREIEELSRVFEGVQGNLSEMNNELRYIAEAVKRMESPMDEWAAEVRSLNLALSEVQKKMYGDRTAGRLDIDTPPSIANRIGMVEYEQGNSTADPTQTHRDQIAIAKEELKPILSEVENLKTRMLQLQEKLEAADAPYTPGRKVRMGNN